VLESSQNWFWEGHDFGRAVNSTQLRALAREQQAFALLDNLQRPERKDLNEEDVNEKEKSAL